MDNFDNIDEIMKLDKYGVMDSVKQFPLQCRQAWAESREVKFPDTYRLKKNIIVCGMGGSRFTPRSVKELYFDRISVPYEIVDDYNLPGYAGPDSLVILSTYSGTTEEVISCARQAFSKGCEVTAVSVGGKVKELLDSNNKPAYYFQDKYNPCGQPRIGGGYLLFGHLGLLNNLGYLKIDNSEIMQALEYAGKISDFFAISVKEDDNQAKKSARLLLDKHPFIIGAEFLRGFVNGFANQINETAKMISDFRYIPELNHHLMEGLTHPQSLHDNGLFLFIDSDLFSDIIKKRISITKEVIAKQQVKVADYKLTGPTKLAQLLEAFTFSSYVTYYLAILYDADPVKIPWVDFFKTELKK